MLTDLLAAVRSLAEPLAPLLQERWFFVNNLNVLQPKLVELDIVMLSLCSPA